MQLTELESKTNVETYEQWLRTQEDGNFWQSSARLGAIRASGKHGRVFVLKDGEEIKAGALVVIDYTTGGYCTWEVARGPLGAERELLLQLLRDRAHDENGLVLYFSPKQELNLGTASHRLIHCTATRMINLQQSEEEILQQMKPKGRYNIKVAQKHGVTVEQSQDIDAFYHLVEQTGKRDQFTTLGKAKYQAFLEHIPGAFLLLARDTSGKAIAGVLSVIWGQMGIYYYGASDYHSRALMAPYLLQWESIRYCQAQGCTQYDLLGVAPPDADVSHPWAGITSFKEKFGGELVTYSEERQIVLRPMMWGLLQWKRRLLG